MSHLPRTSRRPRGARLGLFATIVAAMVASVLPLTAASAQSGVSPTGEFRFLDYGIQGEGDARIGNVDRRLGTIAPTASQIAATEALGATRATWNDFGTPHVLINHQGYLTGPAAGAAVDVARGFVTQNRDLFRLSTSAIADLEVLRDSALYDTTDLALVRAGKQATNLDVAHVVLFRQTFSGLTSARDGLMNIGVAADGRIAYVSSTVTGDSTLEGSFDLSPIDALQAVAADVDFDLGDVSFSDVVDPAWTIINATTTADIQRVRQVALPTPTNGIRRAYEVTLLATEADADGYGNPVAHIGFVDAADGTVWFRTNQVEHFADGEGNQIMAQAAPEGGQFSGTTVAGGCGIDHVFTIGTGQQTITVSVAATTPPEVSDDDIAIELRFGGEIVATQDLLTSPEVLTYSPGGDLPEGDYTVNVCPFNGAAAPAIPYQGIFSASAGAAAEILQPTWRVFPTNPNLTTDPAPSDDTRVLWCWDGRSSADCERDVSNVAARLPWDLDPFTLQPTFTTAGGYASTAISEASFLTPDTAFDRPAPDPTRDYQAAWENKWFESGCDPTNFATDNDDDASVYNLFVMHNRMHDWAYFLGFTERAANLQQSNFGNGAAEGDPELGSAQAGRLTFNGRDNANQITLQDGVPGVTNQYLWQPLAGAFYGTCTDGAYDMAIVAHEYAHAISGRMVGGPDVTLGANQGQGESWSDLAFAEYFRGFGFAPPEGVNPFALAPLVTGDAEAGIRNYGMNRSPLNYAGIQYDGNGTTSPHADGEIWSAVNFDIAEKLNERYEDQWPFTDTELQVDCANGLRNSQDCPGNRRWAQIMFDSFLLMPASPSFVDSRDAMLAADLLRFGGANQVALWDAFAGRGLGEDSSSDGAADPDPIPSFSSPLDDDEANVTFIAGGDGSSSTKMDVYLGHYEARVIPVGNTYDETEGRPPLEEGETAPPLIGDNFDVVAGTYEFVATAPGFGAYRFSLAVRAGEQLEVTVPLRTNQASISNSAEATGIGVNLPMLIDDTETTNWASLDEDAPDELIEGEQVEGRTVTFNLAGSSAVPVAEVNVSAALRPEDTDPEQADTGTQSRFSALRSFDILACNADGGADCSSDAGYTEIFSSSDDAFNGQKPRPTVPDLKLQTFDVTDAMATHLRMVVRDNQCTGGADFQQDRNEVNDPIFQLPDCDSEEMSPDRQVLTPPNHQVRAAEFQVFSSPTEEVSIVTTGGEGSLQRVSGQDRIETGIAISQLAFPRGADSAVLARSDNFPDALAAATLTSQVRGPLLLTAPGELDIRVRRELVRLGVSKLYLAGGTAALSTSVETSSREVVADVERLAGADRFETAALIGQEVVQVGGAVNRVIVARADTFPDALAAANLATYGRSPILLTATSSLPQTTSDAIKSLLGDRGDVIVVGGNLAVAPSVAQGLTSAGYNVTRLAGETRYGTAAAILEAAQAEGVDLQPLLLASGQNFPDALTAGPTAFRLVGALALVHPGSLDNSPETRDYLTTRKGELSNVIVVGGPVAVDELVMAQLASGLNLIRIN